MIHMKKYIREFVECEQGLAYVEFALSLSFLLILFLGSVEVTRCYLLTQKIEKTAFTAADVVTQTNPNTGPVTSSQMSQLMSAVTDMMTPYTTGASDPKILVIVSDITKNGNSTPVLNWQYCGGGALSVSSTIGTTTGSAITGSLPNGLSMNAGEEAVISEVFYNFLPIIIGNGVLGSFQIYRTAVFMPRLGALTGFSSHC